MVREIGHGGLGYFVHKNSKVQQKLRQAGLGTEYYCSLEQWSNGAGTAASDVYSLGIMLAELAAGSPLSIAHVGAGIQVDVVSGQTVGTRAFNAAIRKMTQVFAAQRHPSMLEVSQVLNTAALLP